MLPKPSKLVLATMQLVLFFEREKSLEQSFQKANFKKKAPGSSDHLHVVKNQHMRDQKKKFKEHLCRRALVSIY